MFEIDLTAFTDQYNKLLDSKLAILGLSDENLKEFAEIANSLETSLPDNIVEFLNYLHEQNKFSFEKYLITSGMIVLAVAYDMNIILKSFGIKDVESEIKDGIFVFRRKTYKKRTDRSNYKDRLPALVVDRPKMQSITKEQLEHHLNDKFHTNE